MPSKKDISEIAYTDSPEQNPSDPSDKVATEMMNDLRRVAMELKLTQLWRKKGKVDRAIAGYRKVLTHQPGNADVHKQYINLIVETAGLSAAFEAYGLHLLGTEPIQVAANDLLCCSVVRNEALRLPYFLDYYRSKGVTQFFFVDNGSTDGTLSFLRAQAASQADVFIWQSDFSFNQANFGSVWFELLLRKYGLDRWCVIADADELFYYPDCEEKSIPQLCAELDQRNELAYLAILLDMYSDKAIADTQYYPGQDFRDVCPYFDRMFYHSAQENASPYHNQTIYVGGLRERLFGNAGDYYLSKVPLLKYTQACVLAGGQHWTSYPTQQIAKERGAVLHFKYFSSFLPYVQQEVARKEHYGEALQYEQYAQGIAQNPTLTPYRKERSVRLKDAAQLVDIGIMQRDPAFAIDFEFPAIAPLPPSEPRPFWSVMITCHRPTYIAKTLESVLVQAPSAAAMQIEVVVDGVAESIQAEIRAAVGKIAGDRVHLYFHHEKIGQPYIFNLAIARAKGHWIHILHDDDWLEPTFYQSLQQGLESIGKSGTSPETQFTETQSTDARSTNIKFTVGAAFCRHRYMNQGQQNWISRLERKTPGLIENWLDKIATFCHVQFSAMVVNRSVYETLGGFCPQTNAIADWEMWKRIAVHYAVWYEPQPLMNYREHADSATSTLLRSGQQVAETRTTISITRQYLPADRAVKLTQIALENYAGYALDIASRQLSQNDAEAAIANIREALLCSQSKATQKALVKMLLACSNTL